MARALDIAVTPWSVLGAGILTGKYNPGAEGQGRAKNWNVSPRQYEIAQEVIRIANEIGCSTSQVAIAWVLAQQHSHAAPIIPIIGARNPAQLQDNLGALGVTLSPEQLAQLDKASKIDLGFPHDFLAGNEIRNIVYAGQYANIHNHRNV
jgi:aryl-alcohol dehydrogenase-like predicted oxidoreductase